MKRIHNNQVIVERVGGEGLQQEYIVGKDASLTLILMVRVSGVVSLTPSVTLKGPGSSATILGVIYGTGKGVVNITTLQHHEAPNTTSNLLIKSVMTEESMCRYEGSILVDKRAQKTNAYQRNENLLLGDHAHATSKPALEILANDVRCTHGALVKTLDADELWYAATRGIGGTAARYMILNGFLLSTFDGIADTIVREEAYRETLSLVA